MRTINLNVNGSHPNLPSLGSHQECQYALCTFGIPKQALPVSSSGEMRIDEHLMWIRDRRYLEAQRRQQEMERVVAMHSDNCVPPIPLWTSSPQTEQQSHKSRHQISNADEDITFHPNDVLFGRGKSVVEHDGNAKFRNLVSEYAEEFDKASRHEKTLLTETIVHQIKVSGARFLKRDDGGEWEEVDHETARKKVAHAFRNRRKVSYASSREII